MLLEELHYVGKRRKKGRKVKKEKKIVTKQVRKIKNIEKS